MTNRDDQESGAEMDRHAEAKDIIAAHRAEVRAENAKLNFDKRIAMSELKPGLRLILKSGLRCRLKENDGGPHVTVTIDGCDEEYAVKTIDVMFARFGADLIEVKHTSGESK